jgi:hypothetical protein
MIINIMLCLCLLSWYVLPSISSRSHNSDPKNFSHEIIVRLQNRADPQAFTLKVVHNGNFFHQLRLSGGPDRSIPQRPSLQPSQQSRAAVAASNSQLTRLARFCAYRWQITASDRVLLTRVSPYVS